ncbi:M17 family metallopeptidase [Spiroplasma culicicola]|uniref:Probable cytosol aminopeptidase n=1 Tax=Spiroplasma culicicola AES-1 TaxID=1276246 RepID=W6A8P7_9MOLU|nr:M17 family metallopeptidase [Spiroplasma culicicola]AHI53341.1 leucyl aminopeptidase [Spiroplasma culicicola AES-1]
MITSNKNSYELTLKAITKDSNVNSVVIKEAGVATLVSEDKTIYICLDPKTDLEGLKKVVENFVSSNKYDLNVDLNSFVEIFENKEETFQVLTEAFMFWAHQVVELKKETVKQKSYDLIFDAKYTSIFEESEVKIEFVNFARDLQDLPPNIGTSVEIANRIEQKAKEIDGIKVTIYDKKQIEDMKMGLFLGVNAGSHIEPRLVVLEYVGDPSQKRTALVGKGITFDSGGYNLKPSNFLENMKFDMSGSAIVSSTVMALAKRKAKCNVISVGLLTDNRIGGKATLTESVVTSMNGQTVEITNTDAEGRLVLADGITYAIRNQKAERVITVATLTGAIAIALGRWFTGTFSKHDGFYSEFEQAAKSAQEPVWRQPLIKEHLKAMQCSKVADLTNSEPGREAGSSTAAAFLDSFAEEKEYIHLDIAATADINRRGRAPMTRTMFELLK